jgi:hypothetical protein
MTLREALEEFIKTHTGDYDQKYLVEFIAKAAPQLSASGLPVRILNFTTNENRRERPEWGARTYQDRGYNLLYRNPATGLYTRYLKGTHPKPLVP